MNYYLVVLVTLFIFGFLIFINLRNASNKKLRHSLTGHHKQVQCAKFNFNNIVISGSMDRFIKVWDLKQGFCKSSLNSFASCNSLDFLRGNK